MSVFSSDFILVQFTFASYFCIDPLRTTALKRETQTHSVSATFLNKVGLSLYQSRYFCPALFKLLNSEQYHNEPLNRLNRKQPSLNCSHICFFLQWRVQANWWVFSFKFRYYCLKIQILVYWLVSVLVSVFLLVIWGVFVSGRFKKFRSHVTIQIDTLCKGSWLRVMQASSSLNKQFHQSLLR